MGEEFRIAATTSSLSALCDTLRLSDKVVLAPAANFLELKREDLQIINPETLIAQILTTNPTHVLCEQDLLAEKIKNAFSGNSQIPRIETFSPFSFEALLEGYKNVAKLFLADGDAPGRRIKAQLFDWLNNFNDRIRHKRVAILSSLQPLSLACGYLPDLVRQCGGVAATDKQIIGELQITLEELAAFAPQVLIIAIPNVPLGKNVRNFTYFQNVSGKEQELWENMPAMKRGDVFFADGMKQFYNFGAGVIDTIGTLVSAMAGLDSGYITVRNSFLRLRWIELQRHLFLKDE